MTRVATWSAIALLCIGAAGAALAYRSHLVRQGIAIEAARRDGVDASNARRAHDALQEANARTKAVQAHLDASMAALSASKEELSDERTTSAALQSELAAGRRRLSVLARARADDPAAHGDGARVAGMDQGTALVADLDGRVAGDLEWARQTRNEAVARLDACIAAYDAVRNATNEQQH